ncbi:unnamed protein product [Oikopleura dioica]|uniref:Uncharacterized protein n=1 Tax=Oikopleura dioica TaxID=34765 RepID=E4XAH8_OIKDI|nr:unnamed protein product [Oikopleura dioica]CBY34107.1 unnamed protein product [Oikopleura dioica]CBY34205.1 unnamed protein product [Oikopleura dioica]
MKLSALMALAGSTVSAKRPVNVFMDETLPCDNFAEVFPADQFPDMKTSCKVKSNKKKTKAFCNLLCLNGQHNVWSTKNIKCKRVRNNNDDDYEIGQYRWRPNTIRDAGSLCEVKERCQDPKKIYNLTNKLLSYEKTIDGRRTWYNFSCDDMTSNEKVFEMIPFPTDGVSCTCNFNKPSNVRCKWSKVKNSIVRCVRKDKEDKFFDGSFMYDDMYE